MSPEMRRSMYLQQFLQQAPQQTISSPGQLGMNLLAQGLGQYGMRRNKPSLGAYNHEMANMGGLTVLGGYK